ncbi:hypothetical protein TaPaz_36 [Acinetobacter phage TaPaz]|nr:hypothetical protein TaPaz_36 [Acinetobacter phage TaPaz]
MFLLIAFTIALSYLSVITYTSYTEKVPFWIRKIIDSIVALCFTYLIYLETLS